MTQKDSARQRFVAIQLIRVTGVAMAVFGLVTIAGRTSLPLVAGYALFGIGLFDALAMPIILARRWKSPPS